MNEKRRFTKKKKKKTAVQLLRLAPSRGRSVLRSGSGRTGTGAIRRHISNPTSSPQTLFANSKPRNGRLRIVQAHAGVLYNAMEVTPRAFRAWYVQCIRYSICCRANFKTLQAIPCHWHNHDVSE